MRVHRNMKKRSQTATEYLIILAVVIVIALIVVGVLGGIPGIGGGASRSTSKATWASQPIGVTNWVVDTLGTHLRLRNNQPDAITVHSIVLDDSEISVDSVLSPGETTDVYHFGKYEPSRTEYSYGLAINYTDVTTGARYLQNESSLAINGKSSEGTGTLSADLLEDLHGWWRFDEGYEDLSGNGQDGSAQADAQLSSSEAKVGSAGLVLDGSGDYVSLPSTTTYNYNSDFSIAFWIKPTTMSYYGIFDNYVFSNPPYTGWSVGMTNTGGIAIDYSNAGAADGGERALNTISAGNWNHIAVVVDTSDEWKIYVNGTYNDSYVASSSVSYPLGEPETEIGTGMMDGDFNGSIDDVMIFGRALSATEIEQIYEFGR
mgnify:CR=1 FL=1